ncbi:MAG: tryptophan 2,3-dioxygenase family protein [Fluviicola sp.]
MEKVPYNLYINYEELSTLFNESESRYENMVRCGVASIELTTALLGSFVKEGADMDKISHLMRSLETQFKLLSNYTRSYPGGEYEERLSNNIENLKQTYPYCSDEVDHITRLYFKIADKVKLGLGTQMNEIRAHFGLPRIIAGIGTPARKHGYMGNADLKRLSKFEYYNGEDEIFMRVHQISEYWFNIAIRELEAIATAFNEEEKNHLEISNHFKAAYEILMFLSEHIMILEHMVLSDYHPLRVALRGASGGQSQQAHEVFGVARKIYGQFMGQLKREGTSIVYILENPKQEAEKLAIINNFSRLERSLKMFFFQHYNLSSGTIGSESFGSIGYDLVTLTSKFVQPMFKEIDDAKYDLTMKTNFQYGEVAGTLIMKDENYNLDHEKYGLAEDEDIINDVIQRYFNSISDLNMEDWVQLFATDGYIEDPVGSRPYIGHQQLSVFFKGVLRFFAELEMTIKEQVTKKECTEVSWTAQAKTYNGKDISFHGKEVFHIGAKGEIFAAEVYWGPAMIAEQL